MLRLFVSVWFSSQLRSHHGLTTAGDQQQAHSVGGGAGVATVQDFGCGTNTGTVRANSSCAYKGSTGQAVLGLLVGHRCNFSPSATWLAAPVLPLCCQSWLASPPGWRPQ